MSEGSYHAFRPVLLPRVAFTFRKIIQIPCSPEDSTVLATLFTLLTVWRCRFGQGAALTAFFQRQVHIVRNPSLSYHPFCYPSPLDLTQQ